MCISVVCHRPWLMLGRAPDQILTRVWCILNGSNLGINKATGGGLITWSTRIERFTSLHGYHLRPRVMWYILECLLGTASVKHHAESISISMRNAGSYVSGRPFVNAGGLIRAGTSVLVRRLEHFPGTAVLVYSPILILGRRVTREVLHSARWRDGILHTTAISCRASRGEIGRAHV